MRVVVFTHKRDCPAVRALATENVEHEVALARGKHGYGRNFAELWNAGEPFIAVEHDIAPWPGAIQELALCRGPWCTFRAPMAADGNLVASFFIGRYHPAGEAPESWQHSDAPFFDGEAIPVLRERCAPIPHIHEPPVAHVRAPRSAAR